MSFIVVTTAEPFFFFLWRPFSISYAKARSLALSCNLDGGHNRLSEAAWLVRSMKTLDASERANGGAILSKTKKGETEKANCGAIYHVPTIPLVFAWGGE